MITARPQVGPPEFQDDAGIGAWQCGAARRALDPFHRPGQDVVAEIIPDEMLKIHARRRLNQAFLKQSASVLAGASDGVTARDETRGRARAPSAPGGLGKWQPGGMSLEGRGKGGQNRPSEMRGGEETRWRLGR